MTEEEAKTKWCPFARALSSDDGKTLPVPGHAAFNRINSRGATVGTYCLGSACMAWREQSAPRETLRNYIDAPTVLPKPGMGGRIFPDGWQYEYTDTDRAGYKFDLLHRAAADDVKAGYCGLAGAPA